MRYYTIKNNRIIYDPLATFINNHDCVMPVFITLCFIVAGMVEKM